MDIRNWPIDRIMQLPDWCFGRRWPLGIAQEQSAIATYFDISEAALPEACVIWRFYLWLPFYSVGEIICSFALGDALPTTDAQFDAFEPLFRDVGFRVAGRRTIRVFRPAIETELEMRMPVEAGGRRLVGRFEWVGETFVSVYVNLVISSIPTEVPDWLCSA